MNQADVQMSSQALFTTYTFNKALFITNTLKAFLSLKEHHLFDISCFIIQNCLG